MPTTWVRVRDTSTGAHYDVEARSLRYGMERLNDPRYPDLTGPLARPRPAKVFVDKGGLPAVPGAVVVVKADSGEETVAVPSETGPPPAVEARKTTKSSPAAPATQSPATEKESDR